MLADLLNLVLFDGREEILPSELQILPGDQTYLDSNDDLRGLRRDRYLLWTRGGVVFAFFGLESQTDIDADMPLRGFAYDGISYREQLSAPDGKRYPVITFVLYFGEKPWTQNLTLSERLRFTPELAEAFKSYFNDYHVNVIDVRRLSLDDVKKLRSVLAVIATYFYGLDHIHEDIRLPPVDAKENGALLALFCKTFLNAEEVGQIPLSKIEKGECAMSELIAALMEHQLNTGLERGVAIGRDKGIVIGRKKGREKGRKEGIELGVKQEKQETARRMSELGFSIKQIVEAIQTDQATVESWLAGN